RPECPARAPDTASTRAHPRMRGTDEAATPSRDTRAIGESGESDVSCRRGIGGWRRASSNHSPVDIGGAAPLRSWFHMATIPQDDLLHDARPGGGWLPVLLFGLIAVLMAADVAIDFQQGGATAVESFEALIFASALAGIAFYWRQRVTERRRSQHLDLELAAARAEVRRWAADAQRWNPEAHAAAHALRDDIDR